MKKFVCLFSLIALAEFSQAKCSYWVGFDNLTQGTSVSYNIPSQQVLGPYYFNAGDSIRLWITTGMTSCHLSSSTNWKRDSVPIIPYTNTGNNSACIVLSGGYYEVWTYIESSLHYAFILVANPDAVIETENNILFNAFPNPVTKELKLHFVKEANYAIMVQNSMGELVFQAGGYFLDFEFDTAALPKGVYFVRVKEGDKSFASRKIVKI